MPDTTPATTPTTQALDLLPPPPPPAADADKPTDAPADPPADDKGLGAAELEELCGLLYEDAFNGLGSMYVGRPVELPEKRAKKRGKQLAIAFKKLGWEDAEVLLLMGLCAGAASDLALLKKLKDEAPALPEGAKA